MNKEKTLVISCNAFIDDDDEHKYDGELVMKWFFN